MGRRRATGRFANHEELVENVVAMATRGQPYSVIARRCGISPPTALAIHRDAHLAAARGVIQETFRSSHHKSAATIRAEAARMVRDAAVQREQDGDPEGADILYDLSRSIRKIELNQPKEGSKSNG